MILTTIIKKDNSKNWEIANPVLAANEFGYDYERKVIKIGDGTTAWKDLKGILEASV